MRSDRMRYLREDRGKLVRDGASQRFGGALPDALGSDEHASTPLLSVRVISSRMASMVSLLAISPGGRDARLVAAIGSLSSICPRSTTSMLSPPLGFGLRPDASANRRPKSGCLGSVTSITPPSAGFWKGVSTNALVREHFAYRAHEVGGAPDRRSARAASDQDVAGLPRGRSRPTRTEDTHDRSSGPRARNPARAMSRLLLSMVGGAAVGDVRRRVAAGQSPR